jgi:hypothetical protein
MMMPCESVVKLFIPAIRAGVTKELYKTYNFNQVEIAKKLGITQAAVSKYIAGKYSKEIKSLEENKEIHKYTKKMANSIASKEGGVIESTCYACKGYSGENWKCGVSPIHNVSKRH